MTTAQNNQESKALNILPEPRWCIDSQERSLNFTSPIDFDTKFDNEGMRRGYELLGRVTMQAYIS